MRQHSSTFQIATTLLATSLRLSIPKQGTQELLVHTSVQPCHSISIDWLGISTIIFAIVYNAKSTKHTSILSTSLYNQSSHYQFPFIQLQSTLSLCCSNQASLILLYLLQTSFQSVLHQFQVGTTRQSCNRLMHYQNNYSLQIGAYLRSLSLTTIRSSFRPSRLHYSKSLVSSSSTQLHTTCKLTNKANVQTRLPRLCYDSLLALQKITGNSQNAQHGSNWSLTTRRLQLANPRTRFATTLYQTS